MSQAYDTSAWDPDAMPAPARDDELVLLANESMRARRRPIAVIALWLWQLGFALLVAWPLASTVGAWYGANPAGDAPLWTPGAHALADLVLRCGPGAISGLGTLAMLVFLVAGFADLVPIAALIASMAYVTRERTAPRLRPVIARGASLFPTFAKLFAVAWLVEGVLVAVAFAASAIVSSRATSHLGEARADQLGWLVGLVILGLACVVGVLHDLARAAAVRFRVRPIRACRCAMNAFLRHPLSVVWSWAWRATAGWAPVAIGALVAAKLGGRGGAVLFALAVVHQLVALSRVALRASWLATALRKVDRAHRVIRTH